MKIYAVIESSGEWEDYREYPTYYLLKEKAEERLKKINADRAEGIARREKCCICHDDIHGIDTGCPHYEEEIVDGVRGKYSDCKNAADNLWTIDEHEARLEETEVIE